MGRRRPPAAGVNEPAEAPDNVEAKDDVETPQPVADDRRSCRRRRRRRWAIPAALVFVLWAAVTARVFIWPDLAPLPRSADAIIELAGPAVEGRDQVAINLAREHKAAFLVQSTVVAEAGTHRCLPAVPGVTVLCFHPVPGTTRGEAEWIGREAEMRHWRSVILVTTPDQAWRARLRVSRCFNGKVYGATSPLPFLNWFEQIPYQWYASAKALTVERAC